MEVETQPQCKYLLYPGNHPENIKYAIDSRKLFTEEDYRPHIELNSISFIWKPTNFSNAYYSAIDKANQTRTQHILINHYENLKGICTKNGLLKSLKHYYNHCTQSVDNAYNIFMSTPTSFILQASGDDQNYAIFVHKFKQLLNKNYARECMPSKHCEENVWIVKPSNQNQGRGIEIFKNFISIQQFLETQHPQSKWVVQKYIEKPLLYCGRKFDIRVWALISCMGDLYYYRHGYLRTSSDRFTLEQNEKWVHLTNNCFQCNGEKYGTYEEGNTLSFDAFREYLKTAYPKINVDFDKHILPRIKDLIIDTFLSIKDEYNPKSRDNSFELLGYDFMIDEDLRVWLIECNENPYIGIPNAYIRDMLPKMINSMFEIVLDPVFNIKSTQTQNYWEVLYSEKIVEKRTVIEVNQRQPFSTTIYPFSELAPVKNENRLCLSVYSNTKTLKKIIQKQLILKKSNESTKNISLSTVDKYKGKDPNITKSMLKIEKHKSLAEICNALMNNFKEKTYEKCCNMICNRLNLHTKFTITELEEATDAMSSIFKKYLLIFSQSQYCISILNYYLNYGNQRKEFVMNAIFELVATILRDVFTKRVLYDASIISSLHKSMIIAAKSDSFTDEAKHLIDLVASLGNFDKCNFYIPGYSVEVERQRTLFLSNGLLILMMHFKNEAKSEQAKAYIQSKLSLVDIKIMERQVDIISKFMHTNIEDTPSATLREQKQAERQSLFIKKNSSSSVDYGKKALYSESNEIYQDCLAYGIQNIYGQLHEMYETEIQNNKQKSIETIKMKKIQLEIYTKKCEEERRQKEESKIKAMQLLFQRYESIQKKKQIKMQQESIMKLELQKINETKRKEKILIYKKREEERKRIREIFQKKQQEKEKTQEQELLKLASQIKEQRKITKPRFKSPLILSDDRKLPNVFKELHRSTLLTEKRSPYNSENDEPQMASIMQKPKVPKISRKKIILVDSNDVTLYKVYNTSLHKSKKFKKRQNVTTLNNRDNELEFQD